VNIDDRVSESLSKIGIARDLSIQIMETLNRDNLYIADASTHPSTNHRPEIQPSKVEITIKIST
jgi:hypothetical protein